MPSVEELLSVAEVDANTRSEMDSRIEIDADTRIIRMMPQDELFGVESDEKSERKYFKVHKIVGNGVDLSKLQLRINYQNASRIPSGKDMYIVTDATVYNDEWIYFSWELSRKVTQYKGNIYFIVCAVKADSNGNITNEWNTTLAEYYVRAVYYDENGAFIVGTDGFLANTESVKFAIPYNAKKMKLVIAYLGLSDIGYVKPYIDFLKLIDVDEINRSVVKGMYKTYQNDWEIIEGKWVDIPYGQHIKLTDSRNSCTKNFLHAQKGNELILQSPISFSIMLFSEADDTTCFYNSYKDVRFYTAYKFETDCFLCLTLPIRLI